MGWPAVVPAMSPPAEADKADGTAQAHWQPDAGDPPQGWTLALAGDWQADTASRLPAAPPELAGALRIDAAQLGRWDAPFAARLWQLLGGLDRQRVDVTLDGLPPALRELLDLALPAPKPSSAAATSKASRRPGWVTDLGLRVTASWAETRTTLDFVGEVLLAFARLLRGKADLRGVDLLWQLDQSGPRSVAIVSVVSGLVGVILAYMGAVQLQRFGAESYIADLVTIGAVREVAALMTGIILAGRIGAAFAAQLGSMQANEEIDALRALGINPIDHLVLPRVLALLLVAPLLTAYAALVACAAGWLVAMAIFGVAPAEYLFKSLDALTLPHVLIGLGKGTIYCVLVGLAGCRQGLHAGRSAQAVGQAVTASVVQAIVWIVVAASLLTIAAQRLGW